MNSFSTTARASDAPEFAVPVAEFCRLLTWVLVSLFALVAVLLVTRRLTDALAQPLPALALIATGVATVGAVASIRLLSRQTATMVPLSVALVLVAFSVSLPGSSWLGLSVLWLAVVGEEVWTWQPRRAKSANHIDLAWRHAVDSPQAEQIDSRMAIAEEIAEAFETPAVEAEPADWSNSKLTQQLNYSRAASGGMSIEGWQRADFAAGQRTATLHTAFCPAFSRTPQIESEPLDGPDCEIRSTQTLPWGVRWEVKLTRAATQPTNVVLGFFAAETADF